MLTSPVNVTIATTNGAPFKPHAAPSDAGTRKEPPLPTAHQAQPADTMIEPTLPSNSLVTHVDAVAATAGNRTILQELTLNIAAMLRLARRPDETMTALFIRIIATIEAMPQAERLQFEVRSGLKGQKITLADLAAALRKPNGPEAARLTAIAEAPSAVPGRTAVTAATTTYLQEGTADGHTEETLAMRAAARSSAAGQNVFTAGSKLRPADSQPADAKVLQAQLKSMFEPGESRRAVSAERSAVPDRPAAQAKVAVIEGAVARDAAARTGAGDAPAAERGSSSQPATVSGKVTLSSANLKLDPPLVEKIRTVAQAIAGQASEAPKVETGTPTAKTDLSDRRLQTMLTLKGLVEVVTALPAKAAEILTGVPVEAPIPLPEDTVGNPSLLMPAADGDEPETMLSGDEARVAEEAVPDHAADVVATPDMATESADSQLAASATRPEAEGSAEDTARFADPEGAVPMRPDLAQHGVPFAYAQLQPAREEMIETVSEEEARDETEEEGQDEDSEGEEKRRPHDEYDAIHDPLPEEDPGIIINRDSSEADRAFALYKRMGGF